MNPTAQTPETEHALLNQCLQGNAAALARLRGQHHPALGNILRARGATPIETEELLADLWGDCVLRNDDQPSLLEKFSGRCSLQGWLATVATRRWIDLKRKQQRRGESRSPAEGEAELDPVDQLPAATAGESPDDVLVSLLRESLQAAFKSCPAADLLMLRLVYLHGLSQREVMRMWDWSESKVSRKLTAAMAQIEAQTLQHLRQHDAWLELTWQDFVDLCETNQVGFL